MPPLCAAGAPISLSSSSSSVDPSYLKICNHNKNAKLKRKKKLYLIKEICKEKKNRKKESLESSDSQVSHRLRGKFTRSEGLTTGQSLHQL
jgi:Zn-finger domain-containing protein